MASAAFSCAECGITQWAWGRNRKKADEMAAWHESVGTLCKACQDKKNAAENAAAAERNAAVGLPALLGSEKQVAWAETIRHIIFDSLEKALPIAKAEDRHAAMQQYPAHSSTLAIAQAVKTVSAMLDSKFGERAVEAFLTILRGQDRASWWIERGRSSVEYLAYSMGEELRDALMTGPEPMPEQAAAGEEALLRPAGELSSRVVIEISRHDDSVVLDFPSLDAAEEIARQLRFRWDERRWCRPMTELTGDPLDRMAETAQRFLRAGFLVRVYDEEARRRAETGEFHHERRRWVTMCRPMPGKESLRISWSLRDDFFEAARRIPGAWYERSPGMRVIVFFVPVKAVAEVAAFAEEYGFSLTAEVAAMLGSHRGAVDAAAIVAEFKERPPRATASVEIPDLPVPDGVGIHPDLRDEDD